MWDVYVNVHTMDKKIFPSLSRFWAEHKAERKKKNLWDFIESSEIEIEFKK